MGFLRYVYMFILGFSIFTYFMILYARCEWSRAQQRKTFGRVVGPLHYLWNKLSSPVFNHLFNMEKKHDVTQLAPQKERMTSHEASQKYGMTSHRPIRSRSWPKLWRLRRHTGNRKKRWTSLRPTRRRRWHHPSPHSRSTRRKGWRNHRANAPYMESMTSPQQAKEIGRRHFALLDGLDDIVT
jgi:hypothetical protein